MARPLEEPAFPIAAPAGGRDAPTMIEARALLGRAIARIDELSDIDHQRVSYLEQRSSEHDQQTLDSREAAGTVLDNLLSNAVKFSQPGTRTTVSMRREAKELICTVRDEGPGLSDDDVALLFQRGAQLDPRPTAGESSSGIGLAVALEVAESLGGRIWCDSKKGEGTSFMFALPTDAQANPA